MPAQYPGNSVSKAARAKAGGGFESAIEASGGDPGSGGTGVFAYSAPNGLLDGQELTVTTDGSEGWDFGPAPTELATFGFGQGLLYSAALGFNLQAHTDPHSGAAWTWDAGDFSTKREIVEEAGFRSLRADPDGGFLNFVASQFVPENDKIFISSMSRADYGFVNTIQDTPIEIASVSETEVTLTEPWPYSSKSNSFSTMLAVDPTDIDAGYFKTGGTFTNGSTTVLLDDSPVAGGVQPGWVIGTCDASQWKGLRISDTGGYGSDANSPGRNDFYTSPNNGTNPGWHTDRGAWKYTTPSLSGGAGDLWLKEWIRLDHQFMTGNFDTANGSLSANMLRLEDPNTTAVYNDFYKNDSVAFEVHGVDRRIGAFSWQDFTVGISNQALYRTDIMIQIGSLARLELANSDDPSTTTAAHVLPPFLVDWSTSSAKVLLWKGLFSDYAGKYLHFFDSDGVFRKAVAL